jgi:L-aspartate oxidase
VIPRSLLDIDPASLPAEEADVLVVGSGVAGLSTALAAPAGRRVLLATKGRLAQSATRYAQGGIAAVLGPPEGSGEPQGGAPAGRADGDSVAEHLADTLTAGAGLCDPAAVRVLVEEGGRVVAELARFGVRFDRDPAAAANGHPAGLARTLEGGHSRARVVHAGGDATGAELERALIAAVRADPDVRSVEHAFLVDLVTAGEAVVGALLWVGGRPRVVRTHAVVLASGGAGQLFAVTTNPSLSSGDGPAAALRAGAVLADLEFVQFHPTALHVAGDPRPLISEAMRGEGAVLRDGAGAPVMAGVHPLGDLAPRDVVTRGMAVRMEALGAEHLWLDATGVPPARLERRFPTILARCRAAGIEPTRRWIPVSPAAHYLMGGVVTDLDGRTGLPGLYAVGEAACTGVHGANRLASNSLLEGVVFAARIGRALAAEPTRPPTTAGDRLPGPDPGAAGGQVRGAALGAADGVRAELRRLMTARVGVVRSGHGLAEALAELARLAALAGGGAAGGPAGFEAANLVQLGWAMAELAARREESRGGHWRSDHPDPVEAWRVRQTLSRTVTGELAAGRLPAPAPAGGSGGSRLAPRSAEVPR